MSSNVVEKANAPRDDGSIVDKGQYYVGAKINVHGAGLDVVNGIYMMEGQVDGVGSYSRSARWKGDQHSFSIFRGDSDVTNGETFWYITAMLVPSEPSGMESSVTLYYVPVSEDPDYPPMYGWAKVSSEAKHPLPQVEMERVFSGDAPASAKPVADTYKEMLFSEQFSDVQIICSNGEAVHAHKCVLAASSPYFKAAFGGQWEETRSGQLKTTHAVHIIKTMLTLLYTGKVNIELVKEEPLQYLSVATE